jgi:hypothetical protein
MAVDKIYFTHQIHSERISLKECVQYMIGDFGLIVPQVVPNFNGKITLHP